MAPPSLKLLSFFLLPSLLLSHQAQARSFFFSKVANTNNIPKTEEAPKKETTTNVVTTKQDQEPSFIPQTQTQNGYGLYGHDDSTEATNDVPYNENIPYTHYNPEKSGNFYNNNFETKSQNGVNGNTKLTRQQESYGAKNPSSQNGNMFYNGDERQGMSDTRYVENGKYYYDLESENNNNNNNNNNNDEQSQYRNSELVHSRKGYNNNNNDNNNQQYKNSEMVDSRNWYNNNNDNINNKGYYGSNNEKQSTYENNDVYQNEEFQESEDDQFVP